MAQNLNCSVSIGLKEARDRYYSSLDRIIKKYNRPFPEADEIVLETQEIEVDNGHLQNTNCSAFSESYVAAISKHDTTFNVKSCNRKIFPKTSITAQMLERSNQHLTGIEDDLLACDIESESEPSDAETLYSDNDSDELYTDLQTTQPSCASTDYEDKSLDGNTSATTNSNSDAESADESMSPKLCSVTNQVDQSPKVILDQTFTLASKSKYSIPDKPLESLRFQDRTESCPKNVATIHPLVTCPESLEADDIQKCQSDYGKHSPHKKGVYTGTDSPDVSQAKRRYNSFHHHSSDKTGRKTTNGGDENQSCNNPGNDSSHSVISKLHQAPSKYSDCNIGIDPLHMTTNDVKQFLESKGVSNVLSFCANSRTRRDLTPTRKMTCLTKPKPARFEHLMERMKCQSTPPKNDTGTTSKYESKRPTVHNWISPTMQNLEKNNVMGNEERRVKRSKNHLMTSALSASVPEVYGVSSVSENDDSDALADDEQSSSSIFDDSRNLDSEHFKLARPSTVPKLFAAPSFSTPAKLQNAPYIVSGFSPSTMLSRLTVKSPTVSPQLMHSNRNIFKCPIPVEVRTHSGTIISPPNNLRPPAAVTSTPTRKCANPLDISTISSISSQDAGDWGVQLPGTETNDEENETFVISEGSKLLSPLLKTHIYGVSRRKYKQSKSEDRLERKSHHSCIPHIQGDTFQHRLSIKGSTPFVHPSAYSTGMEFKNKMVCGRDKDNQCSSEISHILDHRNSSGKKTRTRALVPSRVDGSSLALQSEPKCENKTQSNHAIQSCIYSIPNSPVTHGSYKNSNSPVTHGRYNNSNSPVIHRSYNKSNSHVTHRTYNSNSSVTHGSYNNSGLPQDVDEVQLLSSESSDEDVDTFILAEQTMLSSPAKSKIFKGVRPRQSQSSSSGCTKDTKQSCSPHDLPNGNINKWKETNLRPNHRPRSSSSSSSSVALSKLSSKSHGNLHKQYTPSESGLLTRISRSLIHSQKASASSLVMSPKRSRSPSSEQYHKQHSRSKKSKIGNQSDLQSSLNQSRACNGPGSCNLSICFDCCSD